MYYKSAIDRILGFYPYDGSDAEYNNFYNKSLDIETFIFNTTYPRTNGFVDFKGTSHISLKGGPHTIAASNTKGLFKDPQSSQRETANIYDEDIYTTEGLPTDYGQGTRESNLLCDFERGVTVEFWLSSSAISSADQQAVFHITGSGQDDELTIFLSGTTGSPFHVRLKEDGTTILNDEQIGTAPTTSSILGWNHTPYHSRAQVQASHLDSMSMVFSTHKALSAPLVQVHSSSLAHLAMSLLVLQPRLYSTVRWTNSASGRSREQHKRSVETGLVKSEVVLITTFLTPHLVSTTNLTKA